MRVYTNIPMTSSTLAEARRLLQLRNITWIDFLPDKFYYMDEKFNQMRTLEKFLAREKIPFIAIGASYTMEGHVDRSDLYSGRFTYTENLLVIGYTKKLGSFNKTFAVRTQIPSREVGYSHFPKVGDELDTFLNNLRNIEKI